MTHSTRFHIFAASLLILSWSAFQPVRAVSPVSTPDVAGGAAVSPLHQETRIKKLLIVGDSMTGWLGERLEAYGRENGFEVATVVWDGSTIRKWGDSSARLAAIVKKEAPDAVFVSLGLNELLEKNPSARYSESLDRIKEAVGDVPMLWVGPPSWPGKGSGETLNKWLSEKMGSGHFYRSSDLKLGRQSKTNPHPSRAGITAWVDSLMQWIPANTELSFPGVKKPTGPQMVRGKSFTYKKMKESL